jgi:triosephosphate isomerase
MRQPFVAGNWKMFKTVAETRHLVSELVPGLQGINGVQKVICPPFTALLAAHSLLEGTDISLGAQNMHWEASGAFTGEIAPGMIAELCKYVIIGHSERRTYFGETDEMVNMKVRAALKQDLIPIMCVGETFQEFEAEETNAVITRQLRDGLTGVEFSRADMADLPFVVAYEPVWAIGTGRAATPQGANAVIANVIRPVLAERLGLAAADTIRVLYGGSVKGDNAAEFFQMPEIDGALVGGASLKTSEFIRIAQAAVNV